MRSLILSLLLQTAGGATEPVATMPVPARRQLEGLTAEQATELIAKLTVAQRRVRAGEFQPFELLAGATASSETTKRSPRDIFLEIAFDKVWQVRRDPASDRYRQVYRLAYAPDGLGKLYWDIDVAIGAEGDIERVTMIFRPPPPF